MSIKWENWSLVRKLMTNTIVIARMHKNGITTAEESPDMTNQAVNVVRRYMEAELATFNSKTDQEASDAFTIQFEDGSSLIYHSSQEKVADEY